MPMATPQYMSVNRLYTEDVGLVPDDESRREHQTSWCSAPYNIHNYFLYLHKIRPQIKIQYFFQFREREISIISTTWVLILFKKKYNIVPSTLQIFARLLRLICYRSAAFLCEWNTVSIKLKGDVHFWSVGGAYSNVVGRVLDLDRSKGDVVSPCGRKWVKVNIPLNYRVGISSNLESMWSNLGSMDCTPCSRNGWL